MVQLLGDSLQVRGWWLQVPHKNPVGPPTANTLPLGPLHPSVGAPFPCDSLHRSLYQSLSRLLAVCAFAVQPPARLHARVHDVRARFCASVVDLRQRICVVDRRCHGAVAVCATTAIGMHPGVLYEQMFVCCLRCTIARPSLSELSEVAKVRFEVPFYQLSAISSLPYVRLRSSHWPSPL